MKCGLVWQTAVRGSFSDDPINQPEVKMESPIYTPSPIREQTAFMAELTKLRHEYEEKMAALYAGQAEYKAAHSLVETVKSSGVGELDDLYIFVTNRDGALQMIVVVNDHVDALLKAFEINGLTHSSRLSESTQRLIITITGYPRLEFLAPTESISMQEVKCAA